MASLQAYPGKSASSATEITDDMLAAKLVEQGALTIYQADQIKAGRTKLRLGPYIITDWIGQGGMGQVFKAEHEMMGRECAVKVLPLNKSTPEAISHFRREIRTQAKLDHPNLVRAYDAGQDGNVHYLVTEYVPGTDLRRLVRSSGALSVQQAAKVIMQAAYALQYAHDEGLIHRDVKPGNILVTPDGTGKVSDLGLAGFMNEGESDPRAGKIVGTADYLSPEQIRTPNDIAPASDVYSLGCTLYYAVTGKVPFPGGTPREKARRHCDETPWHPRRFNTDINEEFVEIIADMMEKDPKDRINSAGEVASRLEVWAADAAALPSHQLGKSPWMAPPFPSGTDDDDMHDQDTDAGSLAESPSQLSQGTEPVASSTQDTKAIRGRRRRAPLLFFNDPPDPQTQEAVVLALAIAIPTAMLVGALLTLMITSSFR